ncbi:hypothetical protein Y1Q_0019706 [Alligator mississippiensis]|uniref:Uncharacterized protein n=1 Tax=Alligator mississippiensis TaxID=8496 RepID=A0A151PF19_ALLMI|nr:hypothetical protein Y1Q_0019706 [Alligator mississippiensis]
MLHRKTGITKLCQCDLVEKSLLGPRAGRGLTLIRTARPFCQECLEEETVRQTYLGDPHSIQADPRRLIPSASAA